MVEYKLRRIDQGPQDVLGGRAAGGAGAAVGRQGGLALPERRRAAVGHQVELGDDLLLGER